MARAFLMLLLVLCLTADVGAQPLNITVETLEWMAADSKVIVRARIVGEVHEVDAAKAEWDTVVLQVLETLKGEHRPFRTIPLRSWNPIDTKEMLRWKADGSEVLAFLVPSDRTMGPQMARYPLTARTASIDGIIELAPMAMTRGGGERYVYTLNLKNLREPKEIYDACREAISMAEKFKPTRSYEFRVVELPGWVTRVVPVDQRLEMEARRWATSENTWRREAAAGALQYFKAEENIMALKKLLEDPAYRMSDQGADGNIVDPYRFYYIREVAFESLKVLGVEVPEPVLREPAPKQK